MQQNHETLFRAVCIHRRFAFAAPSSARLVVFGFVSNAKFFSLIHVRRRFLLSRALADGVCFLSPAFGVCSSHACVRACVRAFAHSAHICTLCPRLRLECNRNACHCSVSPQLFNDDSRPSYHSSTLSSRLPHSRHSSATHR